MDYPKIDKLLKKLFKTFLEFEKKIKMLILF